MSKVKKVNLNEVALAISELEGSKVPVNITQIKEILSCLGLYLRGNDAEFSLNVMSSLIRASKCKK